MQLYSFVRHFSYQDVPLHTRELVETCLLDIIGVAAGARVNQTSVLLKRYAAANFSATQPASRLWFDGRTVHPLGAAFAGGFSVDSLDAHEGHFTSKGHAGATVVPAVIALVDAYLDQGKDISGEELLIALCIGYETALRAGQVLMATAPEYHASGAFSGIGVVCAGARLLKLDETTFRHALGIAEYFGPRCPMMRLVNYPTMLRDAHGAGAYAGVNALLMAQMGITGAPAAMVEPVDISPFWEDIGTRWEIDEQYFKPWPVCRWAQPALTAMTELMQAHPAIKPESIETVDVETFHESVCLQGHFPKNADEAQYALAFPLAALIARGKLGPGEVTGDAIHAPDILNLSAKITLHEAPDLSARFPEQILSRVTVTLKDGSRLASPTATAKGDPGNPMSSGELLDKYHLLADDSLGITLSHAIQKSVKALPESEDCQAFLDLLLGAPKNLASTG